MRFSARNCTAHEWITCVRHLVPVLYESDPELSRQLDSSLMRLSSQVGDLPCIGYDDPSVPAAEADGFQITPGAILGVFLRPTGGKV